MADSKWTFEVIDADEVQSVPRGRKSNIDPTLVDALRSVKAGQAIRIPSEQCDPTSPDYRKEKARVSAMLRSGMKAAGRTGSIVFTPEGVPQIILR